MADPIPSEAPLGTFCWGWKGQGVFDPGRPLPPTK